MADRVGSEVRSRIMGKIRSKDTAPELVVRRYLHAKGFRYRLHSHKLPGRPDLVLPKYHSVVQVYGCFWHQHPNPSCSDSRVPKSNRNYWEPKLARTRERDESNRKQLQEMGWTVYTVWACEISPVQLKKLTEAIREGAPDA